MLLQPVLLEPVLPPEGDLFIEAVLVHAEDPVVLLPHEVVDLRRRMHDRLLLLVLDGVRDHFAVLLVLHLMGQSVLSKGRLQAEPFAALVAPLALDVGVVEPRVGQQRRLRLEIRPAGGANERLFARVGPDVAGKHLRGGKLLVAAAALVAVLVIELDMAVADSVGSKLLRAVLALEYLLVLSRVLFQPVFLKTVSPLERLALLVFAVIVLAEEPAVLLPEKVIDLGRGERLVGPVAFVSNHLTVHLSLDLVLVLVLVQRHLESERLAALVTLVLLRRRVVAADVLDKSALGHKTGVAAVAREGSLAVVNTHVSLKQRAFRELLAALVTGELLNLGPGADPPTARQWLVLVVLVSFADVVDRRTVLERKWKFLEPRVSKKLMVSKNDVSVFLIKSIKTRFYRSLQLDPLELQLQPDMGDAIVEALKKLINLGRYKA